MLSLIITLYAIGNVLDIGAVTALSCFNCRTNPGSPPGMITPCPDAYDKSTTIVMQCPSGVCLTFVGSQEWRGQKIDGTLRMCLTPKVAEVVYPKSWVRNNTDSGAKVCENVRQQSFHNQTAPNGQPCDPTTQGALTITGLACLCTTDLCNIDRGGGSSTATIPFPSSMCLLVLLFSFNLTMAS